ncbi:MAG: M50 family metallopeptidase, partial [Kiritimatiellae bacterium]|nr:M50 family metallopeptidase [Kiritimatiellia bacterium]
MFNGRYRLTEVFGIPIFVESSFLFLLLIMALNAHSLSLGVAGALMLAVSIVAHELGHALTAAAFGYKTRDITISLLGGCASLIALPRTAWKEFLTAIAGPAVSFLLAFMVLLVDILGIPVTNVWLASMLNWFFWMNVMLGA